MKKQQIQFSANLVRRPDGPTSFVSAESKWLQFKLGHDTGKTYIVHVYAKEGDIELGEIKWYGPFRHYSFFPQPGMVFEKECLLDITRCITKLEEIRLQNLQWNRKNSTPSVAK